MTMKALLEVLDKMSDELDEELQKHFEKKNCGFIIIGVVEHEIGMTSEIVCNIDRKQCIQILRDMANKVESTLPERIN